MGYFYGKLYNSRNRNFSLENWENLIEGTGVDESGQTKPWRNRSLKVDSFFSLECFSESEKKDK